MHFRHWRNVNGETGAKCALRISVMFHNLSQSNLSYPLSSQRICQHALRLHLATAHLTPILISAPQHDDVFELGSLGGVKESVNLSWAFFFFGVFASGVALAIYKTIVFFLTWACTAYFNNKDFVLFYHLAWISNIASHIVPIVHCICQGSLRALAFRYAIVRYISCCLAFTW